MKIFSKFILTVLCANLTFSCFAGCSSSKERARKENEQIQQVLEDQAARDQEAARIQAERAEVVRIQEEQVRIARAQEARIQAERAEAARMEESRRNRLEAIRVQEEQVRIAREQEAARIQAAIRLQEERARIERNQAAIRIQEDRDRAARIQGMGVNIAAIAAGAATVYALFKLFNSDDNNRARPVAQPMNNVIEERVSIARAQEAKVQELRIQEEIRVQAETARAARVQEERVRAAREQEVRDSAIRLAKAQAEEKVLNDAIEERVRMARDQEAKAQEIKVQEESLRLARAREIDKYLKRMAYLGGVNLYNKCDPEYYEQDEHEEDYEQDERAPESSASSSSSLHVQQESSCRIQESACRISKDVSLDYPCIKLSDKQLNSLKQQFDNKLMTPSSWGPSKNITFDYQHIFGSKRKGQNFQMGHADANNILYDYKPFGIKFAGYGPCESYGYRWGDRETLNTFFPDNWEPNKIISKINEVMKSGMTTIEQQQNSIARQGKTSEGLTIKIVFEVKNGNPTGKVKTAYPIID